MNLVSGIHHVAVVTADIDRFIDFYTDVFEMPVIFQETTPAFRHVLLRASSSDSKLASVCKYAKIRGTRK
ncbi:VOC family protein [uncultured Nostoc sp.]|uniref:VOC family protein n=1 Tax=uncultured Nostoc sp. TaxID=340711 RepID=UPI0035CBBCB3